MDAKQKVLGVYELVEAILIHLSLYDLLHASTVCQKFSEVVLTSRTIRRRLESEPIPVFARFQPDDPSTEDLCNVNRSTPWFFRTSVNHGLILILGTAIDNVQLYIPYDQNLSVQMLDGKRTMVRRCL